MSRVQSLSNNTTSFVSNIQRKRHTSSASSLSRVPTSGITSQLSARKCRSWMQVRTNYSLDQQEPASGHSSSSFRARSISPAASPNPPSCWVRRAEKTRDQKTRTAAAAAVTAPETRSGIWTMTAGARTASGKRANPFQAATSQTSGSTGNTKGRRSRTYRSSYPTAHRRRSPSARKFRIGSTTSEPVSRRNRQATADAVNSAGRSSQPRRLVRRRGLVCLMDAKETYQTTS